MRFPFLGVSALILFVLSFNSASAFGQIQNPIQAAKDAYNKAKQQQQQQRQQTQRPQSSPQSAGSSGAAGQSAPAELGPDCCTPEAMKKMAASLGFIDIVGVKLGMTSDEAFAVIKSSNPKLKIDIMNGRVEPGDAPGTFKRYPKFAVAHTVNPKMPTGTAAFFQPDYSAEEIVLEFTLPPGPPLVGKIVRQVTFPQGQPVPVNTLLDAMRKKYGQENFPGASGSTWLYDVNGKLITRQLTDKERVCIPANVFDGWNFQGGGQMPTGDDVLGDQGGATLSGTAAEKNNSERQLPCRPFTIAMTPLGEGNAPNSKMNDMTFMIESPALLDSGLRATHDWLQSQYDAKAKKQDDAAQQRGAPKL